MTIPPAKRWPSNSFYFLLRPLAAGLLCGWLALAAAGAEELDQQSIKQLRDSGLIVPLSAILYDARQRYQLGHLVEAELQRSDAELIYEIEFLDGNGELRELYYDARSGRLLFYEIYSTDKDGRLRSIKYDATDDTPVSYELELRDSSGQLRRYEYDTATEQLLPHAAQEQNTRQERHDAFTAH